jgi:hypothetical protein
MSLQELLENHPELSRNQGDPVFRRSVWEPFFKNLLENKVIYRERFICLARLDELETDEQGVRGIVVPLQFIYMPHYISKPQGQWRFGGSWQYMPPLGNPTQAGQSGLRLHAYAPLRHYSKKTIY